MQSTEDDGGCKMDKIIFNSHDDLAEYMLSRADLGDDVHAILFFEDAAELIRALLAYDDTSVHSIEICEPSFNGYRKEYCVTLDTDFVVYVQPAWHEEGETYDAGYYDIEESYVLLDGDVNSKIMRSLSHCECFEIEINEDAYNGALNDIADCALENAAIIKDEDDNPTDIDIEIDLSKIFKAICLMQL